MIIHTYNFIHVKLCVCVGSLMIHFVEGQDWMWKGILYAVAMFLTAELQTVFFHHHLMTQYIIGLNWRTALMSAIYKKVTRLGRVRF